MWEARYATPDYVFGTAPADFLVRHRRFLTPGRTALSVADGEGRNSVYLAEQGMQVTALELVPRAIEKARALATARGVEVDVRQADLLAVDWGAETFDLVAGIFFQFVGPEDRARLFAGLARAVAPGGLILLHGYRPEQIAYGTGGPPFAENMYTEAMLRDAFPGWEILVLESHDREIVEGTAHVGLSALIDFIARKP